jgi:hypothetical protein
VFLVILYELNNKKTTISNRNTFKKSGMASSKLVKHASKQAPAPNDAAACVKIPRVLLVGFNSYPELN